MLRVRKGFEGGAPLAVVFDIDNTLYPYDPSHQAAIDAVAGKAAAAMGISQDAFMDAFHKARQEVKLRLGATAGAHNRLLYFQRAIELLGRGTRVLTSLDLEQTYWRIFLAHSRLFPGAVELIHFLKSEGIPIALLTDLTAQIQFRKLVYFGIDEYFDYVVTSEEAGQDKPDAQPFDLVLEKLGVPSQRVWMIGDSTANDMIGAGQAGMVKVQKVHDGVEVHKKGGGTPDISFDNFVELEEHLRALPLANDVWRAIDGKGASQRKKWAS